MRLRGLRASARSEREKERRGLGERVQADSVDGGATHVNVPGRVVRGYLSGVGTWGAGIFDSDLALDVRHAFRERVARGADGAKAARELLAEWKAGFDDRDDGHVLWLALAEAAWDAGRLAPSVKKRAVAILASPSAVMSFEGTTLFAKRRAEIARLGRKLAKPPPAPKRITPAKKRDTELAPGDLVVYTLRSGHRALLWVVEMLEDKGGRSPTLELLDWKGKRVPTADALRALRLRPRLGRVAHEPWGHLPAWFEVLDLARKHDPGGRYYIWPEKFVPSYERAKGMGPLIRLGPELEEAIAFELRLDKTKR
jgi:hypothetical protein